MSVPGVKQSLTNLTVKDGEAVELKCEFSGDPEPQVLYKQQQVLFKVKYFLKTMQVP